MLYACDPIRSVYPVTVMTSNWAPLSCAAKSSSACLPAGLTVAFAKSNSESAEKLTLVRIGGAGGGGGGGGGGAATGAAAMGTGVTTGGGGAERPNLYTSPTEKRSMTPLLPTASSIR